jgi:hypothetical protein
MIVCFIFLFFVVVVLVLVIFNYNYLSLHWLPLECSMDDIDTSVIVSLSTIPSRIQYIYPTINSLLRQSKKTMIHLYIPQRANCEPHLSYEIDKHILKCPRIVIVRVDRDTGPSLKFLPAMIYCKTMKKSLIVVDDDNIYEPHFIEKMLAITNIYPHVVHTSRGWKMPQDYRWEHSRTMFSDQFSITSGGEKEKRVAIITGCGGYIFSSTLLQTIPIDELVVADEVPKAMKMMDDIWLSGNLSKWKIKKYVVAGINRFKTNLFTIWSTKHLNNRRAENNNIVIEYFKNIWSNEEMEF